MVTHKEIAEYLKIAPRTVSNILSGKSGYRYSQETRDRVAKAIEELNYRPNRSSQALRRRRSNLIGIIHFGSMAEIARKTDAHLPRIINGEGYDYMAIDLNWHGGNVDRVINELIEARVEGIIISHMTQSFGPRYTEMLAKVGIPAVVIYGDDRLNIPLICEDTSGSYYAMTRHLQEVGHRRLLLLINTYEARPARERQKGFELAMQDRGPVETYDDTNYFDKDNHAPSWVDGEYGRILKVGLGRFGHDPLLAYYEVAKKLMAQPTRPDAVLCFNDIAAFSVCTAAFEAGLRIPSDLAVTGSDNDLLGRFDLYNLTTIEKDIEGASVAAVETLIGLIRGKITTPPPTRFLPSQLVLRKSCGRKISPDEPATFLHPLSTISSETTETTPKAILP